MFTFELRDTQAVGRPYKYLEGRAVPYDTWATVRTEFGAFREQHRFGSFKKTTRHANLPLLLFHENRKFPIGHAESWTHPDDGLHGVWKLNDTADAQQAAKLADNGDLRGLSIGFTDAVDPMWEDPDPREDENLARVTRIESRLHEVSVTPTPAFEEAEIVMVRSAWRPPPVLRDPSYDPDHWWRILEGLRSG